eukprot:NODE_3080_length_1054_cov_34.908458_g2828_i0.p1 GENE.NODE_3080_length_1054_cov_34.908458_g2828_i0~~NODE_3080_length_1054_cov_34.908458_g2828_i0.p1  ORF type:complete len:265 (-),score=80.07 NODE_3080_length_1054_cov_34.908458_g2828_i0:144-938(-)
MLPAVKTMSAGSPSTSSGPAAERLNRVKASMNNLSTSLRSDLDSRKEIEESKLLELRESVHKVEGHLNLETKRRTEADKSLQAFFEQKLVDVGAQLEKMYAVKVDHMQRTIDALSKKVAVLQGDLLAEREVTLKLAAELRHAATASVADVKLALEQEKATRIEREAQLMKKLGEDHRQARQLIEQEAAARAEADLAIRTSTEESFLKVDKDAKRFQAKVLDDIDCMKSSIAIETVEREKGEEQLVHSLDQVMAEVHTSLQVLAR